MQPFSPSLGISSITNNIDQAMSCPLTNSFKKSRTVLTLESNITPSIVLSDGPSDVHSKALAEAISEGVHLGFQFTHVVFIALYKKACHTNRPPSDITCGIKGAYLQGAKGSRAEGTQGAHICHDAGKVDNLLEKSLEQVHEIGLLSPMTKDLFRFGLEMSVEHIEMLEKHHDDIPFMKKVLNHYYPGRSLLENTDLDLRRNAVGVLPSEVNYEDSALERQLRPFYAECTRQVMQGDLAPKEATNAIIQKTINYFAERIQDLKDKIAAGGSVDEISRRQYRLWICEQKVVGVKPLNWELIEKDFLTPKKQSIDVKKTYPLLNRRKIPPFNPDGVNR